MQKKKKIERLILKTILSLADITQIDDRTILFGKTGAIFDSVGLVSFLIELEEAIFDEFKKNISLADQKAMSVTNSPFLNITTLTNYIENLLENE